MAEVEAQVELACSAENVYDFLTHPREAVALSPPEMNLTLVNAPDVLTPGCHVEFQVEAYGMKQPFKHHIMEMDRPHMFREEQLEGLFQSLVHTHRLESNGDGRVKLTDHVVFEPPGGLAGFLLTEKRLVEWMEKSFAYSHAQLRQRFGTP